MGTLIQFPRAYHPPGQTWRHDAVRCSECRRLDDGDRIVGLCPNPTWEPKRLSSPRLCDRFQPARAAQDVQ